MSVAIPIPLLQNLPDVAVTPGVGVDEYALVYDHDMRLFVLRAPFSGTPYALLAGRAGGQTLYGGTAANDDITIHGTSDGTRTTSYVLLQPSGGCVAIGTAGASAYVLSIGSVNNSIVDLATSGTDALVAGFRISSPAKAFGIFTGTAAHALNAKLGIYDYGAAAYRVVIDSAGNFGINDVAPAEALDVTGNINTTGVVKVDDVQVLSNRVIDARASAVANSGDATTDGLIDALRDAMITHGLIAAA